jgi:hypothetical protein
MAAPLPKPSAAVAWLSARRRALSTRRDRLIQYAASFDLQFRIIGEVRIAACAQYRELSSIIVQAGMRVATDSL